MPKFGVGVFMMSKDIKSLWDQVCLLDDIKSFEILFYKLNRNLIIFCDSFIRNEHASEEIVSDIFVTFWGKRAELSDVENPKAYLYRAVKNLAINYLKKYSHFQLHVDLTDNLLLIDASDPNMELEKKELFLKIDHVIRQLPQQTSLVFRLIKEEGKKYQEVAELLDISPRTVQTHMRRALQKITYLLQLYRKREHLGTRDKLYSLIPLIEIGLSAYIF